MPLCFFDASPFGVARGLVTTQGKYDRENLEENMSYEEDLSMDEEDPTTEPKIMEEDSL